jgi:hypothetical protein
MRPIFGDYEDIKHVLALIKDQWEAPPDGSPAGPKMETAHYLIKLLREELIQHGGVIAEQVADANEIVHWYLPVESLVTPDMWQYAFADCMAKLMLYFVQPIGPSDKAAERLAHAGELDRLGESFVAVFQADARRHLSKSFTDMKPDARRGAAVRDRLRQNQSAALAARIKYSAAEKDAWRSHDKAHTTEATRVLNQADRVREVIRKFALPKEASRTVNRALFEK